MSVIPKEWIDIINEKETYKLVATVGRDEVPHVALKGSLHVEGDVLVFYDLIQSSKCNKNLVHAIWFDKKVAVQILSKENRSSLILGKPEKCVTAGKEFERVYVSLQEQKGREVDLSAIWYIKPLSFREETYDVRREQEEEKYPYIRHLDRV